MCIRHLHNEVCECYENIFRQYHIHKDTDLLDKLPKEIFDQLARFEFDHYCEDLHYSLNYERWSENFLRIIRLEKKRADLRAKLNNLEARCAKGHTCDTNRINELRHQIKNTQNEIDRYREKLWATH